MTNLYVLTLFPEMVEHGLNESIIGRAVENNLLQIEAINIREFTKNKHKKVDDYPYGGGAGMVMQAQPIYDAYQSVVKNVGKRPRTIYLTPQGKTFNQEMAKDFAKEETLVFLCGHYEGVDERVLEEVVTDYVSIGDYVLTGGELPAMVMIDAIARMVPGVLTNEESGEAESFENHLLEYPQYSRPEEWMGKMVPEVLLSGHHKNIETWRLEQSILRTQKSRPDLYKEYQKSIGELTEEEEKVLSFIMEYAFLAEERDGTSRNHILRTTKLMELFGKELKKRGMYSEIIDERFLFLMQFVVPLHDIGKMKISDMILLKPGKLTEEEYRRIKEHTTYGADMVRNMLSFLLPKDIVQMASDIALYHHEKYNGTGYPVGLKEEEIPLIARMMAIVDVYDALRDQRCYKEAFPIEEVQEILREDAGKQFDAGLLTIFLESIKKMERIRREFAKE